MPASGEALSEREVITFSAVLNWIPSGLWM
jgi:hypothetical protein